MFGGDSAEVLDSIPDRSIDLIVTDPPYHVTKKQNIHGDTHFESDDQYLEWLGGIAASWRRVLRPNGSLYCFCDSSMAGRIEELLRPNYNVLAHIVWTKPNEPGFDGWKGKMKKEALRQWYPHSERVIFAEPAVEGPLFRSYFAQFLRDARTRAGLSQHKLTELVGAYGKVNHGGAVSNWEAGRNTPSPEQYRKICEAVLNTGQVDQMPPYEDVVRPFNIDPSRPFTDVWDFPSVRPYRGKHPAEKPLDLLEHIIRTSSNEGDIVLDCFAGSGSTAVAAAALGRKSISIEVVDKWIEAILKRVAQTDQDQSSDEGGLSHKSRMMPRDQLPLFSAG